MWFLEKNNQNDSNKVVAVQNLKINDECKYHKYLTFKYFKYFLMLKIRVNKL